MIYLTLGDDYSGIYHSQVLDVCRYFRHFLGVPLRLVTLVPSRNYRYTKRKIQSVVPDATVFPMWPSRFNWRRNILLPRLIQRSLRNEIFLCRGVLATNLALMLRKNLRLKGIIYDARGAIAAEWKEYLHGENERLAGEILQLERRAVSDSDFQMAISNNLIHYWQERFGYMSDRHIVVPTTLGEEFLEPLLHMDDRNALRSRYGYRPDDIIIVYSGSSAGWQSISLIRETVENFFEANEKIKLLALVRKPGPFYPLQEKYPLRVKIQYVPHESVFSILNMTDYGLLIREDSITNKVAAPTKFAEYLAAGNSVILKGNIGDYTSFVGNHNCGLCLNEKELPELRPAASEERNKNNSLAHDYFCKYSDIITQQYQIMVDLSMNLPS